MADPRDYTVAYRAVIGWLQQNAAQFVNMIPQSAEVALGKAVVDAVDAERAKRAPKPPPPAA
jgi:hypothetical protein